jgi:small subunit ribosomal protein S5
MAENQGGAGAGGAVRNVLAGAGVRNILSKCIGTSTPHNDNHATVQALQQLRSAEEALRARGKTLESLSQ